MHLFTILKDKAKIMKIINTLDYLFTMHVKLIRQFACFTKFCYPKVYSVEGNNVLKIRFFHNSVPFSYFSYQRVFQMLSANKQTIEIIESKRFERSSEYGIQHILNNKDSLNTRRV